MFQKTFSLICVAYHRDADGSENSYENNLLVKQMVKMNRNRVESKKET